MGDPGGVLKVALVSPGWPASAVANGVATYVGNLHGALARSGVDVRVLAPVASGTAPPPHVVDLTALRRRESSLRQAARDLRGRLFPMDRSRRRFAAAVLRGLAHLRAGFRPDLVEMEESYGSARLVERRGRVPVVVRLHGPWFLTGPAVGEPQDASFRWRVAKERETISRAVALTSPSADLLDRVRREYGLALEHAEVIPNPAPSVEPAAAWTPAGADRDLLLFVGRFDRLKGGDLVVEAFAALAARRPSLRLAFVGPDRGFAEEGGRSVSLEAFVRERIPTESVRARISHVGQRPLSEVTAYRRRAAVTIVASRYESFALTALEALAHGCPLVAARAGGIPEVVVDGENGLLFEPGDAADLARRVAELLDAPGRAAACGERGAHDARTRFSAGQVALWTRAHYERVLARVGAPAA
jgi:glycosyltransferase involved in cell wall biosynthesis